MGAKIRGLILEMKPDMPTGHCVLKSGAQESGAGRLARGKNDGGSTDPLKHTSVCLDENISTTYKSGTVQNITWNIILI